MALTLQQAEIDEGGFGIFGNAECRLAFIFGFIFIFNFNFIFNLFSFGFGLALLWLSFGFAAVLTLP